MTDSEPAESRPQTVLGRILRHRCLSGSEIHDLRLSSSGNTIVIETAAHVIRIAWCAPIHADAEVRIWREAARVGLPVPELAEHGAVGGRTYLVYQRMPGWPAPIAPGVLHEAGVMLAALHDGADAREFPRELDARPRRARRFALARAFVREHAGRLPGGIGEFVHLAELDWGSSAQTPTHGDFRGPNLLARGNRLSGVLDWSDARRASREADLGSVDWTRFCGVLDGYRTVRSQVRGAELVGYFAGRYAALAAAGVVGRTAALEAMERCVTAVGARGLICERGD